MRNLEEKDSRKSQDFFSTVHLRQRQKLGSAKLFKVKSITFLPKKEKIVRHFVNYVVRALSLKNDCSIYFVDDRQKYGIKTTADYLPESKQMFIYAKDRAFVDILRSVAHEFVHAKQHESGARFSHDFMHFDNELEDEANLLAGELVNAYAEVMGHETIYENR